MSHSSIPRQKNGRGKIRKMEKVIKKWQSGTFIFSVGWWNKVEVHATRLLQASWHTFNFGVVHEVGDPNNDIGIRTTIDSEERLQQSSCAVKEH